ncbi:short chain dehydrogenase [Streptomyces sp. 2231.1]|uniref:SDR family NAD(P)-dependent oxidoreductase n=1 Tax=Streptomyces sp. 2231.1 TaxID=1855347 RepID=UPI00089AD4D6|nr:SDR family NAD(P)-dependent oxidoreductase [Streptomyces sp. 2231.1]SEC11891.1 short chain dehydrogenase [Streptomyces sp. 2231.1]
MARIFVTGSTDGLGLMAAQLLLRQGHTVALHARDNTRARDAHAALPDNAGVARVTLVCGVRGFIACRSSVSVWGS